MHSEETSVKGCLLVHFDRFEDHRGSFEESYHAAKFDKAGLPPMWLQDNVSVSGMGVLRGLHLQRAEPQGKLVRVLQGTIWDVCADVRPGSKTFGQVFSKMLYSCDPVGIYVPPGCAHGFYSFGARNVVHYKCTRLYEPSADGGIRWNDPELSIPWPLTGDPILSEKDKALPLLVDYLKTLS